MTEKKQELRKQVAVRFSEAELKAIRAAAEKAHLQYTTWIRAVVMTAAESKP